jgi:hypothetical protein
MNETRNQQARGEEMTDSTAGAAVLHGPAHARGKPQSTPARRRDSLLYLGLAVAALAVWSISRLGLFTAGSDTGYWIGVAGGLCMLLLFTYPMRKHWRFMQRFGAGKYWFVLHMVLGVAGPLLILLHSTFRVGSINAGVALYSMLIVAISGVIGRFLYVRLHRDLHGEKLNLNELRKAHARHDTPTTQLGFVPLVTQRLADFEREVLAEAGRRPRLLHSLVAVPLHRMQVERTCREELKFKVIALGRTRGWSHDKTASLLRKSRFLVHQELMALQRIAQFSAWEKLFSWWHVAHVPFVYLMVLSALAHVVAVHAY